MSVLQNTQVFSFPLKLQLSGNSKTQKALYSADVSRHFGKGSRQGLYLDPGCLPKPIPPYLKFMVYLESPEIQRQGSKVYRLVRSAKQAESGTRYEPLGIHAQEIGTVYFARGMFRDHPPYECFLCVWFESSPAAIVTK